MYLTDGRRGFERLLESRFIDCGLEGCRNLVQDIVSVIATSVVSGVRVKAAQPAVLGRLRQIFVVLRIELGRRSE